MTRRLLALLLPLALLTATAAWGQGAAEEASPTQNYTTESLRGEVVWLAEAMKRRFDVEMDPRIGDRLTALQTPEGRVLPIVPDARGRGFSKDERIRGIPVELLVRRYEGSPMIQVIRVYAIRDGEKLILDYWCDVCAIPMFEQKECECCQEPNRLRLRPE